MKVALVHDYIKEYGGAERVLEALHELFPEAPVYTSVYLPQYLGPHRARFKSWDIRPSWLQYIPGKAKLISPFRLITPFIFKRLDLSMYDVVIVSATGAYAPNLIRTKNGRHEARHICYCHTPPRYLYGYATAREWKKNIFWKILGETANHVLRLVDYRSSLRVDQFVANSGEVRSRIKRFYKKDALVIYPPVEVDNHTANKKSVQSEYYLTGGRLARPKHIDVGVKTCTQLGLPLKVFGKAFAGYGTELASFAGKTVEFVGEVSDTEKLTLMAEAKAFLFTSEDEDFGITPVEAMGEGTPVIAYRSGGVKETVVDGKTGLFFDQLSVASLGEAIKQFEKQKWSREACHRQAEKFSKAQFMKRMKDLVEE